MASPTLARRPSHALSPWLAGTLELKTEKQNAHSGTIWSVVFSPDGSQIVSGSGDKTIKVWEVVDVARKLKCHEHFIYSCSKDKHGCDLCSKKGTQYRSMESDFDLCSDCYRKEHDPANDPTKVWSGGACNRQERPLPVKTDILRTPTQTRWS